MPSVSPEQKRFFGIVHAIQSGKMKLTKAQGKTKKAAKEMNPSDVKDFLMECFNLKKCSVETKKRLIITLKSLNENYEDSNPNVNVVASSKRFHGDFKETLKGYRGYMLTPKEHQAATNGDIKPTVLNNFNIGFSKSDPVGNTSTVMIKKLREPNGQYVYTAIVKVRGGEDQEEPEIAAPESADQAPAQPAPQQPSTSNSAPQQSALTEGLAGDEIRIIKSVPISIHGNEKTADSISGDEILTNFINTIYRKYA